MKVSRNQANYRAALDAVRVLCYLLGITGLARVSAGHWAWEPA